jgi:transcriptional regulator with XRE-family HTH domain
MKGNQLRVAFGRALSSARTRLPLSQDALAEASNMDRTAISLLERGLRTPSLETVFALAPALNLSPAELVEATTVLLKAQKRSR